MHHQIGILMPNSEARSPFAVPVTALLLNRFCHTTASVHCGMMYGKMKTELIQRRAAMFVLVTRKATTPP